MTDVIAGHGAIPIGRQGENLVTRVVLPNLRSGAGSVILLHQRARDRTPYPVTTTEDGSHVYWVVSSADTAIDGMGRLELQWQGTGGEILKSRIWQTYCQKSLTKPGDPPEPWEDYIGDVSANAKAARDARDAAEQYATTAYNAAITATENAETSGNRADDAASSASAAQESADDAAQSLQALKDGIASGDFKGEPGENAPQIDDAAISAENPWSSRHIVDMLCPPMAESGNPVVCYPVAGYALGVVASWEPKQEGSGEPSPDNIRPITGRETVRVERAGENGETLDLTLPRTIYGGAVNAVTGEGEETWMLVTLDGNSDVHPFREEEDTDTYKGFYVVGAVIGVDISRYAICSHFKRGAATSAGYHPNEFVAHYPNEDLFLRTEIPGVTSVETFRAYLAAQYAAGTPVQIAYKLATPVPFAATGGQAIPALPGVNTILTDADSVTVTGRADPIKRILDLEDAVASMTT